MSHFSRIDLTPKITERGLAAVGPRELARAERLALRNPQALTQYGAESFRRKRR